jgi:hypothetical protein
MTLNFERIELWFLMKTLLIFATACKLVRRLRLSGGDVLAPPSGIGQSRFPRETSPYSLIQSDGILPTLPRGLLLVTIQSIAQTMCFSGPFLQEGEVSRYLKKTRKTLDHEEAPRPEPRGQYLPLVRLPAARSCNSDRVVVRR